MKRVLLVLGVLALAGTAGAWELNDPARPNELAYRSTTRITAFVHDSSVGDQDTPHRLWIRTEDDPTEVCVRQNQVPRWLLRNDAEAARRYIAVNNITERTFTTLLRARASGSPITLVITSVCELKAIEG